MTTYLLLYSPSILLVDFVFFSFFHQNFFHTIIITVTITVTVTITTSE